MVLANNPLPPSDVMMGFTIEDYARIAATVAVLPSVAVPEGALVAAHSLVIANVEPNTVVAGSPAKFGCETSKIKLKVGFGLSPYPWRRHFHRGYSEELITRWLDELHT